MKMIDNIKKKALENHIPIIMDDTLEVVSKILEKVRPKNILEIGTAVGYSAICFSEYLADSGCIDTIERDEQRAKEAIENIKKVGAEEKADSYCQTREPGGCHRHHGIVCRVRRDGNGYHRIWKPEGLPGDVPRNHERTECTDEMQIRDRR